MPRKDEIDDEYFEWLRLGNAVVDDYLSRTLAHVGESPDPGTEQERGRVPATELVHCHLVGQRYLPYVATSGSSDADVLTAVLAWMLAQHPQLEIEIRLRTAARKLGQLGQRAEFRDAEGLGWSGPQNNRPAWLKARYAKPNA